MCVCVQCANIFMYNKILLLHGSKTRIPDPDAGSTSPHVPVLLGGWRLSPVDFPLAKLSLGMDHCEDLVKMQGTIHAIHGIYGYSNNNHHHSSNDNNNSNNNLKTKKNNNNNDNTNTNTNSNNDDNR